MKVLLLSIICLSSITFFACSTTRKIIVNTNPSGVDVFVKGNKSDGFPSYKVYIGKSPLEIAEISFHDLEGDKQVLEVQELIEDSKNFFLVLEKYCFDGKSISIPDEFPQGQEIRLIKSTECKSEKK